MTREQPTTLAPGQRATWRRTMRGGYGYTEDVPVVIRRVCRERITVEAPLRGGGVKVVSVLPCSLRVFRHEPEVSRGR